MIPQYPKSKKLKLEDKKEVEDVTGGHLPYSDFNFVSLWSWDVDEKAEISLLNGNLVVKFVDYLDGSEFLSVSGGHKINQTLSTLVKAGGALKLVPEHVIDGLEPSHDFKVMSDEDNFDYVLSVSEVGEMKGSKFLSKRSHINKFKRLHGEKIKMAELNVGDAGTRNQILETFYKWEKERGRDRKETERELEAVKRLLRGAASFKIGGVGLWHEKRLIGFSIDEIVQHDWAMIHFEKADTNYSGIFEFLKQQTAIKLAEKGCKFINLEQDLGIPGLREAKRSYRPINMLKKYTIYQGSDL